MRPGIRSQELIVPREALLQIDIHRVVSRIAIRRLRADRTKRRDRSGCAQCATGGQSAIEYRRRDCAAGQSLYQEIVWRAGPEEVGGRRLNYATASCN